MNEKANIKRKSRNAHEKTHPYKKVKQLNNIAYGKWKKETERCVICGTECLTTKEHVPPQSIFAKTPADVVTVRACSNCQKSPDREFADFLADYCVQKGATRSSRELLSYRKKRSRENGMSANYMEHVIHNSNLTKTYKKNKSGIITPALLAKWPSSFHDPIILKMVHGFYWLLTGGEILSDEEGRVIIISDFDPNIRGGDFFVGRAFPSINIGRNQFICAHIQGFEEPYKTIVSMSFHFHTDGNTKTGYHVMIFFCLDKLLSLDSGYKKTMEEIFNMVDPNRVFDIQKATYLYYPY